VHISLDLCRTGLMAPSVPERLDQAGGDRGRVDAGGVITQLVDERRAQRPGLGGAAWTIPELQGRREAAGGRAQPWNGSVSPAGPAKAVTASVAPIAAGHRGQWLTIVVTRSGRRTHG
jgi:hypothetical protein